MSGTAETAIQTFVPKAAEIAREAGARLREYFIAGVETEYKGDVDLVTVADRTVEKLIRGRLGEIFPEHGIYGEEGTRERMDSEYRWYVDPLDGTTNFAHGFPQFCVSMGLEHRPKGTQPDEDGTLVAGVIYDPMRDELFTAERGRGTQVNGKPARVSRVAELAEALLATGFPSRKRHASPNIHFYNEFTLRSHGVRRAGSAALDLAYVACGRLEAFWEFNLNPWDTAAGILLVEEAGGRVTDFAGAHYRLASEEILASNGLIHEELVGFFSDMFAGRNLSPIPTAEEFAKNRERGNKGARKPRLSALGSGTAGLRSMSHFTRWLALPSVPAANGRLPSLPCSPVPLLPVFLLLSASRSSVQHLKIRLPEIPGESRNGIRHCRTLYRHQGHRLRGRLSRRLHPPQER